MNLLLIYVEYSSSFLAQNIKYFFPLNPNSVMQDVLLKGKFKAEKFFSFILVRFLRSSKIIEAEKILYSNFSLTKNGTKILPFLFLAGVIILTAPALLN